jgi:multidrug efflux pump subunit AcrB
MWIVKIALSRPYTFIVLALLILILSPVIILRTPTDIFPNINIPVVAVAWIYTGLSPEEIEGRTTTVYERSLTTTVDNIDAGVLPLNRQRQTTTAPCPRIGKQLSALSRR